MYQRVAIFLTDLQWMMWMEMIISKATLEEGDP